ncbi:hypothetical protein BJ170DRAFT_670714 [Xylariales sp. AK1849]|nr:hypothetical protein BJ170DRAFT_670714 [Xylariales sp. AK1849]
MESLVKTAFSPLLQELFSSVKTTCPLEIYQAVLRERDGVLTRDDDCVSFEMAVRKHFYEQPWIHERQRRFEATVGFSCSVPRMWFCPRLPKDLELMYTIYFLYGFLVDDEEPQVSDYMSLVTMDTAPTPFMASFRSHLDKMKENFSEEEYWYFLKGFIDFILMTRIEYSLHGRVHTLSKSSINFPWHWKQLATSATPHIYMALRNFSDLVLEKGSASWNVTYHSSTIFVAGTKKGL